MKKEKVNSYTLSNAFRALEALELPEPQTEKGYKAETVKLSEMAYLPRGTEALVEDYFNIDNKEGLEAAQDEVEIAKAKLDKIERIVDLDAKTVDEIKPTYVGKTIIQCPQCMTLFYKDEADLEHSEEDATIVNIGEVCQHCGNDTGYTIVGKVAADEPAEEEKQEESEVKPETEEEPVKEEEPTKEEKPAEEINLDTVDLELPEAEQTEEPKVESLKEATLAKKIQDKLAEEEPVKENIGDDEAAKVIVEPVEVVDEKEIIEQPAGEISEQGFKETDNGNTTTTATEIFKTADELVAALADKLADDDELYVNITHQDEDENKCLDASFNITKGDLVRLLLANKEPEETETEVETEAEVEEPVEQEIEATDTEAEEVPEEEKLELDFDEIEEESLNNHITKYLKEVYENVDCFKTEDCDLDGKCLKINGIICFNSGAEKPTTFEFNTDCGHDEATNSYAFTGTNADLCDNDAFTIVCTDKDHCLVTESLAYNYTINGNKVTGKTK